MTEPAKGLACTDGMTTPLVCDVCLPSQDEEEDITPGYKTPKQVDLKTLQELDADDESLIKYKQTLLGATSDVLGKRWVGW